MRSSVKYILEFFVLFLQFSNNMEDILKKQASKISDRSIPLYKSQKFWKDCYSYYNNKKTSEGLKFIPYFYSHVIVIKNI